MNRLYLFLSLIFCSMFLQAQHERGDVMVEGISTVQFNQPRYGRGDGGDLVLLKSGYFFTNRLQVGAALGLGDNLYLDSGGGNIRLLPYVRYYLSNREGKNLRPFVELGFGTLSEEGAEASFRPALGLEYEAAPGLFGKVTLQGDVHANRAQTVTLDFSTSVSLTQVLADRQKKNTLERGDWLINTDFGYLSYFDSQSGLTEGLYGSFDLEAKHFLTDRWSFSGGLRYNRDYGRYDYGGERRLLLNTSVLSLNLGVDYNLRKYGIFQPYVGGGIDLSRNVIDYDAENYPNLGTVDFREVNTAINPYLKAGTYIHLSDRVLLDLNMNYRLGNLNFDQGRTGINLKMVYRFGN